MEVFRGISGAAASKTSFRGAVRPYASPEPSVLFGKTKPDRQDPKPRLGLHNLRSLAIVATGILGWYAGPGLAGRFHQWATQRTVRQEPLLEKNIGDKVLDGLAATDVGLRQLPGVPGVMDYYTQFLAWDGLYLAWSVRKGISKRSVRPDQLWKELNARGITGKNLKVGVVDSGYLPTKTLPEERVEYLTPQDFNKLAEPADGAGHGTAVANLIARGAPESRFIIAAYSTQEQEREIHRNVYRFFKQGQENPDSVTLNGLRQIFTPMIENIARGVRATVDRGAHVVNVSLSVEQAVQMNLLMQRVLNTLTMGKKYLFSLQRFRDPEGFKTSMEKYMAFSKKLTELAQANMESEVINDQIKELYKPWLEALDYAHGKGVPVVLAAGNSGGNWAKAGNLIGNINLLAAFKHPTLIVVGSANHEGEVSEFTSEMNDELSPLIAGNGSGDIATQTQERRGWLSKIYSPFWAFGKKYQYENPQGTSFAAPDVALLYLKMKAVNPDLTVEEAREILAKTAMDAHFSPKYEKMLMQKLVRNKVLAAMDFQLAAYVKSPLFDTQFGEELDKLTKDPKRALKIQASVRLEVGETGVHVEYLGVLEEADQALMLKALENTLTRALKEQMNIHLSPEEIKEALAKELKRRVGQGVVCRLDAVDEVIRRAQNKKKPDN